MSSDFSARVYLLCLSLPAFITAFAIHEFAHAWASNKLGDDTARRMGRLTLDPLAHLDLVGSLLFVISMLQGFGIGWAKPVPFNPRNFDNPRRDAMWVALAGPISNVIQAAIWLAMLWILRLVVDNGAPMRAADAYLASLGGDHSTWLSVIVAVVSLGVLVNILLATFNMIPMPPLDGHYVLEFLGPPAISQLFEQIRPWSILILFGLSYLGILGMIISPARDFATRLTLMALGVPL